MDKSDKVRTMSDVAIFSQEGAIERASVQVI